MKKKLLVLVTIVSVMSWILVPGVFADSANHENANKGQSQAVEKSNGKDKLTDKGNTKVDVKLLQETKAKLEAEKNALESEKDALETQKDTLEEQLEAAKTAGNTELATQLAAQIDTLKKEIESKKQLMKEKQSEVKATIRGTYTEEELSNIEQLTEKLKNENKGIRVMSVDSIVAKGRNLKFDTPPVIKDGRMLIPVRALSEGFGATVGWDPVAKKVTISNGTTQIVLTLGSNIALVNGVEVTIDAAATTLNNRTIVPLRFITETLGLKVDWDNETDTVEIGDDADTTTPPVATGDTTTVPVTTPATGDTATVPTTTPETPATGTTDSTITPTTETPATGTTDTTTAPTTEIPATTPTETTTTETTTTTTPATETTTTTNAQ